MATGAISQIRLYVQRQASSAGRYVLEQTVLEAFGWIPMLVGIGVRAVAYRLILKMHGAAAIEKGLQVSDLVLWDPVVTGERYLTDLRRIQRSLVTHEQSHHLDPAAVRNPVRNRPRSGFPHPCRLPFAGPSHRQQQTRPAACRQSPVGL